MADVKMDVAKAKVWIMNVQKELEATEATLDEVRDKCWSDPGENDTVVHLLEKTGTMLDTTWKASTNAFKNAWEALEEGINEFGRLGDKIQDAFEELKTKI